MTEIITEIDGMTVNDYLYCRKCGTRLVVGENWPQSWAETDNRICQPCHYKYYGGQRKTNRKRGIRHCTYCKQLIPPPFSSNSAACDPCNKWIRNASLDWLHLQLGNKCAWCERTAQQIRLEVDHLIPSLDFRNPENHQQTKHGVMYLIKEFVAGVELRLLCLQCHKARHCL